MRRHHGIDRIPAHWRISDEGSNRLRDVDGGAGRGLRRHPEAFGPGGGRIESRATVTEVDLPERLVTLKDERGQEIVVEVPDRVKSLDQVKAGDEVIVSYTTAVAWQVRRAGDAAPGVSEQTTFNTEKAGEKPAGTLGRSVTLTTTITAIDLANDTVTLSGPEGRSRTIKVREPADSAQSPGGRPRRHHVQRSSGDRGAAGREEVTARAVRTKPGPFACHSTVGSTYSLSSGSMPGRTARFFGGVPRRHQHLNREAESRCQRRPTPQRRRAASHARVVACLQLPRRRDDLPA